MTAILLAALSISIALHLYHLLAMALLGRDHAWGIRSQGSWQLQLWFAQLRAIVQPVAIVHLDIDRLKTLNTVLGEERVNRMLRQALRRSELSRTQHGDECMALLWGRAAQPERAAQAMLNRLHALPLSAQERSLLGGPISATVVYSPPTRALHRTIRELVTQREALKAQGRRNHVACLDTATARVARVQP